LFASDCIGEQAFLTASMLKAGEVLLLEKPSFLQAGKKKVTKHC